MKLWGGRFTKETNQLVHSFNESLSFDSRLFRQDIRGSIAHVTMLAKQGILTNTERDLILEGLNSILAVMRVAHCSLICSTRIFTALSKPI